MNRVFRLLVALGVAAWAPLQAQVPQLISYQGRVAAGGAEFHGSGQFKFALVGTNKAGALQSFWSNDGTGSAGSEPAGAVTLEVSRGLFSVLLGDVTSGNMRLLPATVFTNADVRVRIWFSDGTNGFQRLSPDQRMAAVGYALMAASVADGSVTSAKLADGAVTAAKLAPSAVGAASLAPGQVVRSLNALKDDVVLAAGSNVTVTANGNVLQISAAGPAANAWTLAGNTGAGGGFLGTLDNQPLELRVNSQRALRLEPNATSPNVVGGAGANVVAAGVMGAVVGGGGSGSEPNSAGAGAHYATISGGRANQAGAGSESAAVGGGVHNIVGSNAAFATIGGGIWNTVQTNASRAVIGGGDANTAAGALAVVGGGYGNTARGQDSVVGGGSGNAALGFRSVVGGGVGNAATNYAATVPGGADNAARGDYSLAAGRRAKAGHPGAFVWADSTDADFASTATNEFAIRAAGGVRVVASSFQVAGGAILGDGAGLSNMSGAALSPGSITGVQLAAGTVQASNLAPGAVGPVQLTRRYDAGRVEAGADGPFQGVLNPDGSLSLSIPFNFGFATAPIVTLGIEEASGAGGASISAVVSGKTLTNFSVRAQGIEPVLSVVYGQAGRVALDAQNDVGDYNSMAEVAGAPALSCYDKTRKALVYMRALDTRGSSWMAPVIVDAGPNAGVHSSLAVVSNGPGIAYIDSLNGSLKFARALTAEGAAWAAPRTVATNAYGYVSLALVEGRPAIAYTSLPDYQLAYVRALDSQGGNWSAPVLLEPGLAVTHASLAVVNGRPAIAYHDATEDTPAVHHDSLKYVRALDATGGAWGSPLTLQAASWVTSYAVSYKTLGFGEYASLCVVNGRPAVLFRCRSYHPSDNYLHGALYARADDADGQAWPGFVVLAKGDYRTQGSALYGKTIMGVNTRLTVVNNLPVAVFSGAMYHRADSTSPEVVTPLLAFGRAIDASGQSWSQCSVIHWGQSLPSLAPVNGVPGVVFYEDHRLSYFQPSETAWGQWPSPTVLPVTAPEPAGLIGQCVSADALPLVVFHDPSKGDLKAVKALNASGSAWSGTAVAVDTGGNAGLDTSAALVDGAMAIAYRDAGRGHVRFVRAEGAGWSLPVTVDAAADDGLYPSMAVVWGNPCATYYDAHSGNLKFTRALTADGSSWGSRISLDSVGATAQRSSLVVVSGAPAVAYMGPNLEYVRALDKLGGKWGVPVTITTDVSAASGQRPSMAVVNGRPGIAFCTRANGLQFVRASDATGAGWGAFVKVDPDAMVGEFCSLAVVSNYPVIAYYDRGHGDLMCAVALDTNGAAWATPVVVDASGDAGPYASLADSGQGPAIAYWAASSGDLRYVQAADGLGKVWQTPVAVDTTGAVGEGACLVFDETGAAVSYYDRSSAALKVAREGWTTQVVDGGSSVGKFLSLALVGGRPAVSHYDESEKTLRFARAANTAGTSWSAAMTVDAGPLAGMFTSLAEVATNPAVAYYDQANGNLKYVRAANSAGTAWNAPLVVDASGDAGRFASLAVVNGRPAIAYYDATRGDLKYVRAADSTGAVWGTPVTPDGGDVGQDVGQYASLAVVNGKPAIAYYDVRFGEVKYVRASDADGASWSPYRALDKTDDVGRYVTLRVVSGKPAVSYYSVTGGDLKLVRALDADGASWEAPLTLDSAGDAGRYAVLSEVKGNPSVSYWDYSNGRVKNYYPVKSFLLNWFAIEP